MKKLNGYRPTHRNKWYFVEFGLLSHQELMLWEYYADIVDFDNRHANFGLFEVEFNDLASIFNCKSPNTIRNWHNRLLSIGLIKKTAKIHIYSLTCHERFVATSYMGGKASVYAKNEANNSFESLIESFGLNFQNIKTKLQPIVNNHTKRTVSIKKIDSKALSSSKVDVNESSNMNQEFIVEEDHNTTSLSDEDIRWIRHSLNESPLVPS